MKPSSAFPTLVPASALRLALWLALPAALFLALPPAAAAQSDGGAGNAVVRDSAVQPPAAAPDEAAPAAVPAAPLKAAEPLTGFAGYGGPDLFKALGAFVVVMLLLTLALKGLGRLRGGIRGRGSIFELRGIHALDNRKYLAAVTVEGRMLVVGVTPESITPVAQWILEPDDEGLNFASLRDAPQEAGPDFKLPAEQEPPARRPSRPAKTRPEDMGVSAADPREGRKK